MKKNASVSSPKSGAKVQSEISIQQSEPTADTKVEAKKCCAIL